VSALHRAKLKQSSISKRAEFSIADRRIVVETANRLDNNTITAVNSFLRDVRWRSDMNANLRISAFKNAKFWPICARVGSRRPCPHWLGQASKARQWLGAGSLRKGGASLDQSHDRKASLHQSEYWQ
jgi:hypothetical protein